jgi:hypothetical protein
MAGENAEISPCGPDSGPGTALPRATLSGAGQAQTNPALRGWGGNERAAEAALSRPLPWCGFYGDGSVNSDVCGFRYGNRLAPASHLPDRFQIRSPRVMSDS